MRFVFFSDIHVHNYKTFSHPTPNGVNTRAQECLNAIRYVREYCVKNKIAYAIFGGDLFNVKGVIDVPVWNAVYDEIMLFGAEHINLIMIPGQHDMVSEKTGYVNALETLPTDIINKPTVWKPIISDAPRFVLIPYQHEWGLFNTSLKELLSKNERSIIIGHACVAGAMVNNKHMLIGIAQSSFDTKDIKCVFMGDIHLRQSLVTKHCGITINYPGSLLQNSFGDRDQQKGFFDVNTEDDTITTVMVPSREFKVITIQEHLDYSADNFKDAYLRLEVPDNISPESVKAKLVEWGITDFIITTKTPDSASVAVTSVDLDMDERTLVGEWVNNQDTKLNKDRLVSIGNKIVESNK